MQQFKKNRVIKKAQPITVFSLCIITVLFYILSVFFSANIALAEPEGYARAKVELSRLMQDDKRAGFRHNWLSLAEDFSELYRNNADWNNRPAALFRSAKALHEMARRSFVRKDAQQAASTYEELAQKHKMSPLADDSLYAAATIYHELLRDSKKAKAILKDIKMRYAKSDFAPKAKEYLAQMDGNVLASLGSPNMSAPHKKASLSLNTITPQLRNDVVRIVLSMSSISAWRAKYFPSEHGEQPGIMVTLNDVAPSEKMSLEDTFKKSGIFTGYTIEYNAAAAQSSVLLQFSKLARYTVKTEKEPARIIIEATHSTKQLAHGIKVGDNKPTKEKQAPTITQNKPDPKKSQTTQGNTEKDLLHSQSNLAAQLGLAVRTIVIDPGHGGKDPGAQHHGLTEKDLNLDVAKRLKNVLSSAGYKVFLTRSDDRYIGLYERTDIARKHKADLFISIHANAHKKSTVTGFETYFLDFSDDPDAIRVAAIENLGVEPKGLGEMEKILGDMLLKSRINESKRLARMVQYNSLRKAKNNGFTVKDGGTRGAPFHVLIGSSMPSILVEIGYSSNPDEAKRLKSYAYRDSIAEGIANGIHQYAQDLLTANKD